jgi:AAA15 family ATPase/GTPase
MIKQLAINNFRGFSEYRIDDIGQVNLLVGTNNCGKTTVLEAIHLLKSRGNLSALFSIFKKRNKYFEYEDDEFPIESGDLCRFFHGFEMKKGSKFQVSSSDTRENEISLLASVKKYSEISTKKHLQKHLFRVPPFDHGFDFIFHVNWKNGNEKEELFYGIAPKGRLVNELGGTYQLSVFSKEKNLNIEYVPSSSVATNKVVQLFNNIVLTKDEELVLDAIRIVDPDIIRLASIGEGYQEIENYIRGGILVKSKKWEERVPIGNFGDGIWRLLGLILSLVGAKNGTLLIDEIDTGLHHTVMAKMWKLICTTAKKLNVQVFATTHSSDCWRTLADNAVEEEFADMAIRLHRIDKDKKHPETFTNREMNLAFNREIEVR